MWSRLTQTQKEQYKKYCDNKYGKTIVFCETGEPLYFDDDCNIIDTRIVFELLLSTIEN